MKVSTAYRRYAFAMAAVERQVMSVNGYVTRAESNERHDAENDLIKLGAGYRNEFGDFVCTLEHQPPKRMQWNDIIKAYAPMETEQ